MAPRPFAHPAKTHPETQKMYRERHKAYVKAMESATDRIMQVLTIEEAHEIIWRMRADIVRLKRGE